MGQFWELSDEVFNRIDDSNHASYEHFMVDNPYIAKCRGVNINV